MAADPFGRLVEVLDARVRAGESIYLSVLSRPLGSSSFSGDNWVHLRGFARELARRSAAGDVVVAVVRRFEAWNGPPDPNRPKTVWCYRIDGDRVVGVTADEFRHASSYHHETGAPLPPERGVTYVDAVKAMPEYRCSDDVLDPSAPPRTRPATDRAARRRALGLRVVR